MGDYKKKYERALYNFNIIKAANKDNKEIVAFIEHEYPELKESSDERIRKEIIAYMRYERKSTEEEIENRFIPWLEKQGRQNTNVVHPIFRVGDYIKNKKTSDKVLIEQLDVKSKTYCYASYDGAAEIHSDFPFSKQDEWELIGQKVVEQKPADKVEPKFKVGDWAVWDNKISCHVDNIYQGKESLMYTITDTHNMTRSYSVKGFDNNARLWTIQDAKDGDVIFSNDGHGSDSIELIKSIYDKRINFWFCLSSKNNFKDYQYEVHNGNIPYTNFASRKDATPATREQRNLLFAKMKEAGYEWDADKKELNKIEQKPVLSEEDKYNFSTVLMLIRNADISAKLANNLSDWIKFIKERVRPQTKQEVTWSEEDENILGDAITAVDLMLTSEFQESNPNLYKSFIIAKNWLKSLKERYTWKPSDEQMEALNDAVRLYKSTHFDSHHYKIETLYKDLKKLKGE